jgi:hypothetical protein
MSAERHFQLPGESSSENGPQVVIPLVPQPLQASFEEFDGFDCDDGGLAKAPTLLINEVGRESDSPAPIGLPDATPKFYIQGVIHSQQVYVVTNLLDGKSQILFQPQMVWTIGRNRDAALPLRDRVLSRRHAVILYVPADGFHLIDLNSMNGSYINGARIQQRQLLQDGDCIRLGNVEFSFFTSSTSRIIAPIHPEVLARFTNPKARPQDFIDFSALEEPEILFNTRRNNEGKEIDQ